MAKHARNELVGEISSTVEVTVKLSITATHAEGDRLGEIARDAIEAASERAEAAIDGMNADAGVQASLVSLRLSSLVITGKP